MQQDVPDFQIKNMFIFDFDGVLVDSVDVKTKAFIEIYKAYGSEIVDKIVLHHTQNGGMNRFDKFKYYHKEFLGLPINSDTIGSLSDKFSSIVVEKILRSDEIKGAIDCLDFCMQNGIICAIDSATPENELNYIVLRKGWKKYFKYILGSPNTKSKNIKKILNSKVDPKKTLFFGDSMSDYLAAKENKIDFIGINFLYKNDQSFLSFSNLTEFLRYYKEQ